MPGLTSFPALDVAIGLAFLYFVMSTGLSLINEAIANVLGWRAKTLEDGVRTMLGEPKARRELREWFGFYGAHAAGDLTGELFDHWRIQGLVRNPASPRRRRGRPSYLPANAFSLALAETIAQRTPPAIDGVSPWEQADREIFDRVQQAVLALPPGQARALLTKAAANAGGDLDRFRLHLETAYDDAMARASGWYKRKVQTVVIVLAALATLALNVDSAEIAQRMWSDAPLRSAVVAQAGATRNGSSPATAAEAVDQIRQLHLPIGWGAGNGPSGFWSFVDNFPGWLITVAALSLGAPFWFDLLSRVSRLRGAGIETKPRRLSDTAGTGARST